jgi:hypothetical protein
MLKDKEIGFLLPFVQKEIDELMHGNWDAVKDDVADMHQLAAKLIRMEEQC